MCVVLQRLRTTCKTLHIFLWSSLLLAACSAVPDEVAVTTSANQFDYLGASPSPYGKIFDNEDGESYGVAVTATYKLKPQRVTIVDPVRAPPIYDSFDSAGQFARNLGNDALEDLDKRAQKKLEDAVQGIITVSQQEPKKPTRWWIYLLPLILLVFWLIIRRRL